MEKQPDDTTKFLGMKLKDVRALYPNVRVVSAGTVPFVGTCDYRTDRLNVSLSDENLVFEDKKVSVGDREYALKGVVGSLDEGIVIQANWG